MPEEKGPNEPMLDGPMTEEAAQLRDERDQPNPTRDQVRRTAPMALCVAAGAGSVLATPFRLFDRVLCG